MKNTNYKQRLQNITTFVFDIDGVFTGGEIFFHPLGKTIRSLNAKDGYAVTEAIDKGYNIAVITRGNSPIVAEVFLELGITDVFLEVFDKGKKIEEYSINKNIPLENILYMGDDIPDYYCIQKAGVGTCPRDAVKEVREIADYISTFDGGKGAVRDVVEQTMRLQGKWFLPS